MRILFVDDDSLVLYALSIALKPEESPWEMVFALGGEAGLAHLRAESYDVIVTELFMAGIDGAVLLAEARRRSPSTVRVALSASLDLYPDADAHIFLGKPCKLTDLRSALEDIAKYLA